MQNRTVSIWLAVTLVLSLGLISCGGGPVPDLVEYDLTMTNTEGGLLTFHREASFTNVPRHSVDLTAEADKGYRFVKYTGDADTLEDVNAGSSMMIVENDYSTAAIFMGAEAGDVGIQAGDWLRLEYTYTGWPAGEAYPEWLNVEFLSVEGTMVNVRFTQHVSDGTEQSDTALVDIASSIDAPLLEGFVTFANLTAGDLVYVAGHGNVTIEHEATRTYAGANRTVVYASFWHDEAQVTYYWDRLTGVMVEVSSIYPDFTATAKATETNIWRPTTVPWVWWPWTLVAVVAVGLVVFFLRRRRTA